MRTSVNGSLRGRAARSNRSGRFESIEREDFDYAELAGQGGLQRAWKLFGVELDGLMNEMNQELVA